MSSHTRTLAQKGLTQEWQWNQDASRKVLLVCLPVPAPRIMGLDGKRWLGGQPSLEPNVYPTYETRLFCAFNWDSVVIVVPSVRRGISSGHHLSTELRLNGGEGSYHNRRKKKSFERAGKLQHCHAMTSSCFLRPAVPVVRASKSSDALQKKRNTCWQENNSAVL